MTGRVASPNRLSQAEPVTRLGPSGFDPARWVADELTRQASNLERYPFESATMNEAARMAADALRRIRRDLLNNYAEKSA